METRNAFRENWKVGILAVLFVSNLLIWSGVYAKDTDALVVSFFDVGQGDAMLIESPSGARIIIDGGQNRKVVSELGKALPFGDRRVDVVLATHPDADHIGGLPEVFDRYDVEVFIEPGVESESSLDAELEEKVGEEKARRLVARRGMVLDLGDGAVLTILFPNQDVSRWNANDASVVALLEYGESSFLLTGDIELRTEGVLLGQNADELDVDVLKVGHHGSRTSSSQSFLEAVTPEYSVISAGKDNRYGHPHQEVVDRLRVFGSEIFNTGDVGTIVFETDGEVLKVK